MDDLKLFAKDDNDLGGLLQTVRKFIDDTDMSFGLDKCAKATFKRTKLTGTTSVELDRNTVIKDLEQERMYKYLGVDESKGIQHAAMKEKIRKECYQRVREILKKELNSANRIEAINTLTIAVVTYSFNIINWTITEIRRLDTKIRKLLTCNRMHHPKDDVDTLYIPRNEGGRGLMQLELSYKTSTIGQHKYITTTTDWMLQLFVAHDKTKKAHSISKQSYKFKQELNIHQNDENDTKTFTKQARNTKKTAKTGGLMQIKQNWENKPVHGKYPLRSQKADVDQGNTHP